MKGKEKGLSIGIMLGKPKKNGEEEPEEDTSVAKKDAASRVASAVKSGDSSKLAQALEDFIDICKGY